MTVHHVGVSGGKDSTALLLWAVYESGYPLESLDVTFNDTGNEAQETYDYLAMLNEKVHSITSITPERDFYELARHKKRFPTTRARFCTQMLKMEPTKAYIQYLQSQGHEVLMHSGVRAGESFDRAKLEEREPAWLSYFGAEVYRPLLRWSIEDVWAIHERYGIPPNPLYSMGCKRVGCLPCIMSRKKEIANIAQRWPERIAMIRENEVSVRNGCGYSSMFARDKVPERYRTRPITDKKGQQMNVATVDDVVRWALNDPELYTEEFDFYEDAPLACDSRYGACE